MTIILALASFQARHETPPTNNNRSRGAGGVWGVAAATPHTPPAPRLRLLLVGGVSCRAWKLARAKMIVIIHFYHPAPPQLVILSS